MVRQCLRDMHSDAWKDEDLGERENLIQPDEPEHLLDHSETKLKDFIRKHRHQNQTESHTKLLNTVRDTTIMETSPDGGVKKVPVDNS